MFKLEEGTDTGPLMGQVRITIDDDETSTLLYRKVIEAHRRLIREVHPRLEDGSVQLIAQDEASATVWPGRKPSDGQFCAAQMTIADVDRLVRALTHPYPGAFTIANGRVLRVWEGSRVPAGNAIRLETLDGTYYVTDYEWEHPASEAAGE
jgi:methionyl-tRNA formyltransferase